MIQSRIIIHGRVHIIDHALRRVHTCQSYAPHHYFSILFPFEIHRYLTRLKFNAFFVLCHFHYCVLTKRIVIAFDILRQCILYFAFEAYDLIEREWKYFVKRYLFNIHYIKSRTNLVNK